MKVNIEFNTEREEDFKARAGFTDEEMNQLDAVAKKHGLKPVDAVMGAQGIVEMTFRHAVQNLDFEGLLNGIDGEMANFKKVKGEQGKESK